MTESDRRGRKSPPLGLPQAPLGSDRFAIVVAQWNAEVTEKMLQGALETLRMANVATENIEVVRTPGAWEIPLVAQRLARTRRFAALICLGAVIQGETTHDEHINRGVTLALGKIALECDLPILLGILTCYTMEQALDRAGGRVGNKGSECAEAAVYMVALLKTIAEVSN